MLDVNLLINIGQIRPLDSHFCKLRHIPGSYSCLDKANTGGGGGEIVSGGGGGQIINAGGRMNMQSFLCHNFASPSYRFVLFWPYSCAVIKILSFFIYCNPYNLILHCKMT